MFTKNRKLENKTTINQAADKYIEAILDTGEYRQYALQRDKLLLQKDLYEKVKEYRTKNYLIQTRREGDDLLNAMEDLQREYESILEIPMVEDFMAAELAFCRMMQELNNQIADALNFV